MKLRLTTAGRIVIFILLVIVLGVGGFFGYRYISNETTLIQDFLSDDVTGESNSAEPAKEINTSDPTINLSLDEWIGWKPIIDASDFNHLYKEFDQGTISLYTEDSRFSAFEKEVVCDIHIDHFPVRSFGIMLNTFSNVIRSYEKLTHRNNKKDDAHLNKHAMHLIRLYMMCIDILEEEEIKTYRENDREFLLSIRNGAFQNKDGTYRKEFFELVDDYEKKLTYAKQNTSLPLSPNMDRIEEFVMSVNRRSLYESN